MLLNWKKDNINVIPLESKDPSVVLKRSYVTLLPGVNEIRDDEYKVALPHIKSHIDNGSLEELKEKTQTCPGKPQRNATSLVDVPIKRAIALIKETNNPETFNYWLAIENRAEVRRHISDRMKELEIEENPMEDVDLPESSKKTDKDDEEEHDEE
jgi:hypothetical protein